MWVVHLTMKSEWRASSQFVTYTLISRVSNMLHHVYSLVPTEQDPVGFTPHGEKAGVR